VASEEAAVGAGAALTSDPGEAAVAPEKSVVAEEELAWGDKVEAAGLDEWAQRLPEHLRDFRMNYSLNERDSWRRKALIGRHLFIEKDFINFLTPNPLQDVSLCRSRQSVAL
jgi:hypothetical protein